MLDKRPQFKFAYSKLQVSLQCEGTEKHHNLTIASILTFINPFLSFFLQERKEKVNKC